MQIWSLYCKARGLTLSVHTTALKACLQSRCQAVWFSGYRTNHWLSGIILILCLFVSAEAKSTFYDSTIADIVEKVGPSVVNIVSKQNVQQYSYYRQPGNGFFDFFFKVPNNIIPKKAGEGSGFIFDAAGLILTNFHVIEEADSIEVTLSDGRKFNAVIQGQDPAKDIAILKIQDEHFKGVFSEEFVAKFGDSTKLRVGEWVIAIGSPFSLDRTVTVGIVSAKGRNLDLGPDKSYNNLIQTDASINPGNSGGPLLNLSGEVIGINTAINPLGQGLGFAIPINLAKRISSDIVKFGKVQESWMGVYIENMDIEKARWLGLEIPKGVIIRKVVPESPAGRAGFQSGDVILRINGVLIEEASMLTEKLQEVPVGESAKVEIFRKGKTIVSDVIMKKKGDLEGSLATFAGRIGVSFREISFMDRLKLGLKKKTGGLLIESVSADSLAQGAGLQAGDVLIQVNRFKVSSFEDLKNLDAQMNSMKEVILVVIRDGYLSYVELEW